MVWNEKDHPRGQPGNVGQFVKKDGKSVGEGKTYRQNARYSEILADDRKRENQRPNVKLTSQEWAMFYERIGKIKKEGHYTAQTAAGDMLIPIETRDSNVLIIAGGTYQKPVVKLALRFKNQDAMYSIIKVWEKDL